MEARCNFNQKWKASCPVQVVVFNISTPGNIIKALMGDTEVGTTVSANLQTEVSESAQWRNQWQSGCTSDNAENLVGKR